MDLFHWRKLSNSVKFTHTKKQYFGRYLWRAEFTIRKAHLVTDGYIQDITGYVKSKQSNNVPVYSSGPKYPTSHYYREKHAGEWLNVDCSLLERIKVLVLAHNNTEIKFRVEYNTLQVYTETEEQLKEICDLIDRDSGLRIVTGPKEGTEQYLRDGHVYMSKIQYKFKITLRDGSYNFDIKQSVLNQLTQRSDVKIPPALERELGRKYPALWGGYFYTDDDSIVTILSLIAPGIVSKVHPINHF